MPKPRIPPLKVMVSSTVYGKEALLNQIYAVLNGYGYKVWNSHKGTLPLIPGAHAYDMCLAAVERCDIFLGLISPQYGSGTDGAGGPSITHRELDLAIALGKPRFLMVHEQVVLARRLLLDLGLGTAEDRVALRLKKGAAVIDDLRLIDMYESGTQEGIPVPQRRSNWVQKYQNDQDVLLCISEQFDRRDELRDLVERTKPGKDGGS